MRPALEVRDLTVRFGETTAVDGVDLTVRQGDLLAILGPSGCGKSSLLRAIAGLEDTDSGTVEWAGEPVDDLPVHRRGFGLMFQEGQLFPHRSVAGNVEFGLRMAGLDRAERAERVARLLDLVGLSGFGDRVVATLSGGEQQRVALARSLAPEPRLLLLDEPLSALDRGLRERLAGDLRRILVHAGATAIYVTHDQDESFTVADRVAVMSHGRLLQEDRPLGLWRHPVDRDVARFLGYRAFVRTSDLGASVLGAEADDLLALRPESLVLDESGPLRGTVLGKQVTRGGLVVQVQLDGVGQVEATAADPLDPRWVELWPGSTVRMRLEPGATGVVGPRPVNDEPRYEWQA